MGCEVGGFGEGGEEGGGLLCWGVLCNNDHI